MCASLIGAGELWRQVAPHYWVTKMAQSELVAATNELFDIQRHSGKLPVTAVADAMSTSCKAIKAMLDDVGLAREIDQLAEESIRQQFLAERSHLQDLCRTFVRTEEIVLRDAGLSDGAIRSLMEAGRDTLELCARAKLDVAQLYTTLHRLEQRVCGRADQIVRTMSVRRENIAIGSTVARASVGLGGAAIVAINAGAFGATSGLSAPMATMSAAFGGTLVSAAIGSPWDR